MTLHAACGAGLARATPRRLLYAAATLALAACASPPLDMRPAAGLFDQAPIENRPVTRPLRAITSFSESLACMDRMLRDQGVGTTLIASKSIPDPTGRAGAAVQAMIITALSQMSQVSNAFRVVDYEVDIVRQDTVQNLTGLLLNANQMNLQRPALYVSGAVSYVDQGIVRNSEQLGTSASRLETGYSASWNATLIGLELHLGDFRTRTLIPGLDSANDIVFGARGQGFDVAARIGRYGVQFNLSRATAMGSGAAIRTLVELGTIELVGKWARVPYWQCLMLDRTNPAFERQFRDWFQAIEKESSGAPLGIASPDQRVVYTKRALAAAGYFDGPIDASRTPAFKQALARYQSDHRLVVSGDITFETFRNLFTDYVAIDDQGQLQRVGWDRIEPVGQPLTLELDIANQKFVAGEFDHGERIYLTATLSREAHLYCFYQDTKGRVSRLFPNPFQRDGAVPGNRLLRIPDWLVMNPGFSLRAGAPGLEAMRCYASERDLWAELPEPLRGTAILPLAGVDSLRAVDGAMAEVGAAHPMAIAQVQWHIKPAPQQAATPASGPQAPAAATQAQVVRVSNPPDPPLTVQRRRLQWPDAPPGHWRIVEGDNLTHIARSTGVAMDDLQRWNGLSEPNRLMSGSLLRLFAPDERIEDLLEVDASGRTAPPKVRATDPAAPARERTQPLTSVQPEGEPPLGA